MRVWWMTGFKHLDTLNFDPKQFPGYRHRTTRADATQAGVTEKDTSHCKTFVLVPSSAPVKEEAELTGFSMASAK